ncbi:ORC ubiquitin ligase 1 [Discoglossus pictus]
MAQNVQNVTLSLTLPITCHICLGKVRRPVICGNNHVFCSVCIELWLKNNNQCPACRVPITPEHPCKDIIGGTGENEGTLSHSVRKHLRKTRLDLLHKDYEEEIESLLEEIENVKGRNADLEEQLNMRVDSIAMSSSSVCNCGNKPTENNNGINNQTLEEWSKKIHAAKHTTKKLADDMEKLKEENKRLRNDNNEIVRENLRLKNEVDLRSPQKFGRFTVAALQAKVDQYEREMNRLKKALERSDQYIEELEGQVENLKKPTDPHQKEESGSDNSAHTDENVTSKGAGAELHFQDVKRELVRSRSHESCDGISGINLENLHSSSSSSHSHRSALNIDPSFTGNEWAPSVQGMAFGESCTSITNVLDKDKPWEITFDKQTPSKDKYLPDCSSPSTSLLPFGSLQLNTPNSKPTHSFNQMNIKKPLTYLRKLTFDEFPKKDKTGFAKTDTSLHTDKEPASDSCHASRVNYESQKGNTEISKQGSNIELRKLVRGPCLFKTLQTMNDDEKYQPKTSSETSMDTAFHGEVCELENMVSDLESSQNFSHSKVASKLSKSVTNFHSKPGNRTKKTSETPVCSQSSFQSGNGKLQTPKPLLASYTHDIDGHFFGNMSNSTSQSKDQTLFSTSPFKKPRTGQDAQLASTSVCATSHNSDNVHAAKRKLTNFSSESPTKSFKH